MTPTQPTAFCNDRCSAEIARVLRKRQRTVVRRRQYGADSGGARLRCARLLSHSHDPIAERSRFVPRNRNNPFRTVSNALVVHYDARCLNLSRCSFVNSKTCFRFNCYNDVFWIDDNFAQIVWLTNFVPARDNADPLCVLVCVLVRSRSVSVTLLGETDCRLRRSARNERDVDQR
jgi:hypothetical protein